MSILSSTNSGKAYWLNPIKVFCDRYHILLCHSEPIIVNGSFILKVVPGCDVIISGYDMAQLPANMYFDNLLDGAFVCSHSKLKSMVGFPKRVGLLDISFSGIDTLDGIPEEVNGHVLAVGTPFDESQIRERCNVHGRVIV